MLTSGKGWLYCSKTLGDSKTPLSKLRVFKSKMRVSCFWFFFFFVAWYVRGQYSQRLFHSVKLLVYSVLYISDLDIQIIIVDAPDRTAEFRTGWGSVTIKIWFFFFSQITGNNVNTKWKSGNWLISSCGEQCTERPHSFSICFSSMAKGFAMQLHENANWSPKETMFQTPWNCFLKITKLPLISTSPICFRL